MCSSDLHFLWLMIAWWTGGAWVLYFSDAPTLVRELATFENLTAECDATQEQLAEALFGDRPRASFRTVLPMFVAATVVTPLGIYALVVANERALRIGIGVAVLLSVFGTMLARRPERERAQHWWHTLGVGVLSGLMRGSTGMGGPPVVVYEHWRGAPSDAIRRRLLAYFALTGISGTLLAAGQGVFTTTSKIGRAHV